uniref:Uncharacterized protein n=1 Tax=Cucumis melo TaxID=3656 RepID=A0A9I9EA53_CUCME
MGLPYNSINVERHIALIVHYVDPLSVCLGSSSSSSFQTQIHDDGAWRAREAALDEIRGSPEDSYKIIPKFAYILELNNLGSVVEYKVYADSKFLYFFMALSASISGWQHCCPVISIDGTSLKNKYGDFTKTIEGILREQLERNRSMKVNLVNNMKYQVTDGTFQYVVYLPTKAIIDNGKYMMILCPLSSSHLM